MSKKLFGDNNHYYSDPHPRERKPGGKWDSPVESKIRHLLTSQKVDVKKRVENTCKQANLAIREYLRSETALKLSQPERRQTVPYQVVDGIPLLLASKLEKLPDTILLLFMQKRQLLKTGITALEFIDEYFSEIMKLLGREGSDDFDALEASAQFIDEFLSKLNTFKLPDILIKEIEEDILGAYYFHVPKIEIYWMPIGLVAGMLDVTVEDLSFVILAHELAHAYTHLGQDIDGVRWETEAFAQSSTMIVEGLAQFYTESICKKCRQRSVLDAFEKLLAQQSKPYTHFKEWKKENAAEIVRFSMISARTRNIHDYDTFMKDMDDIGSKVKLKIRQQSLIW